jgi:hypothetical protein
MLRHLEGNEDEEENEDDEPDNELKETLEPKVTESKREDVRRQLKLKRKRLTWPKKVKL